AGRGRGRRRRAGAGRRAGRAGAALRARRPGGRGGRTAAGDGTGARGAQPVPVAAPRLAARRDGRGHRGGGSVTAVRWSRPQVNSATTSRRLPDGSGAVKARPQRVGAEPVRGRAGAKARAASSTVQDHRVRSATVRRTGGGTPGARTSHSVQTPPPGAVSTSKRRSGQ